MNLIAKNNLGPQRLAVRWVDAPPIGPLLICRRAAGYGIGTPQLAWRAADLSLRGGCDRSAPRAGANASLSARLRAFTLLELMLVIAIIGFIAALTLPHVAGFGQANSMATAARQVLDDVALARQRAMVNRSTVYMVFLPPMFWNNPYYSYASGQQISNLVMHQYSAYALVSLATVGDQPGQHHAQFVTDWRFLPSGVFIAPFEFTLTNTITNIPTTNTLAGTTVVNTVHPWTYVQVPFPSLYPPNTIMYLPAIGFTPQGQLATTPPYINQYIALARGSIFYPTDTNGMPLFMPPNLAEVPPGNDVSNPNLIQIDWMTARATLIQNQFQ